MQWFKTGVHWKQTKERQPNTGLKVESSGIISQTGQTYAQHPSNYRDNIIIEHVKKNIALHQQSMGAIGYIFVIVFV